MSNLNDIKKIKNLCEEFFEKMTLPAAVEVKISSVKPAADELLEKESPSEIKTVVLNIKTDSPQILIGERGQTLLEIQYLLRKALNKKLEEPFYLDLDINEYKKKKTEYLKTLAKDLADEVMLTKEERVLMPMSSYERRIIHLELANRTDVVTESQGQEPERKVIIKPR